MHISYESERERERLRDYASSSGFEEVHKNFGFLSLATLQLGVIVIIFNNQ